MWESNRQLYTNGASKASRRKSNDALPMWLLVTLSSVLLVFALAVLAPPMEEPEDTPVLQTSRERGSKLMLVHNHYQKAPILYGLLHTLPAALWCVCMPLQHVKRIRSRYPSVHRWSGRVALLLSVGVSLTGMLLTAKKLLYTQSLFHIHTFRVGQQTVLVWPSSEAWVWTVGPWLLIAAVQTYVYARRKDWAGHRRWANWTTVIGYIVPMQRVVNVAIVVFGHILPLLSKQGQHPWLHIPYEFDGRERAEKSAFALSLWTTTAIMLVPAFLIRDRKAL